MFPAPRPWRPLHTYDHTQARVPGPVLPCYAFCLSEGENIYIYTL